MPDDLVDDIARAKLRDISYALTGKASYRLEVALAVVQLGLPSFYVRDVCALLPPDAISQTPNVSRNLQCFVDASFLEQAVRAGPYQFVPHPFWTFVEETWESCLDSARVESGGHVHSPAQGRAAASARRRRSSEAG